MRRLLIVLQDFCLRLVWRVRTGARVSVLSAFTTNCRFGRNVRVERMCILHNVEIGDYSYIGDGSRVIRTRIGRFCSISGSVHIGLGSHPTGMVSTSPAFHSNRSAIRTKWLEKRPAFEEYRQTIIGNDVWIGMRALIRDGITVGDGAVIGAGAVVTKDVEPYSVMAGVPARCIRKRFDDDTVRRLLETRWWDWPAERIRRAAGDFADTGTFLKNHAENAEDAHRAR